MCWKPDARKGVREMTRTFGTEVAASATARAISDIAHGIHDYQPLEGDLCGLPVTGKDGLACLISDLGPAECGIVFGSCADDGGVTVVVDARNGLVFACTPEGTCDVQCLDDDAARTLAGAWRKARTQTETKETA
jgi:hypothetical protein